MQDFTTDIQKPGYVRIESDLRRRIATGQWSVGSKIPGRVVLAREYGVALATMERAVANLLQDGTLVADGGRGTFVAGVSEATGETSQNSKPGSELSMLATERNVVQSDFSKTVGILTNYTLPGGFFGLRIIEALEHSLSDAGYATVYFSRAAKPGYVPTVEQAFNSLRSSGARGFVVVDDLPIADEIVASIDIESTPVVFVSWDATTAPISQVFYDQRYAGHLAARHLLKQGARRITFLAPFSDDWVDKRIAGARDAILSAGLAASDFVVYQEEAEFIQPDDHQSLGYELALRALSDNVPLDAVITPNDNVALGIWRAVTEAGLKVGADVKLIGFDDNVDSRVIGLTSLRPPSQLMGEEAARMIVAMLRGEATPLQSRLRSHIVVRDSTRSIAGSRDTALLGHEKERILAGIQ